MFGGKKVKKDLDQLKGLENYISEEMDKWKVPGLAVSVVKDGEVIYRKGFGYRDLEQQLPVTEDTIRPRAISR